MSGSKTDRYDSLCPTCGHKTTHQPSPGEVGEPLSDLGTAMNDPLAPDPPTLIKLGSIARHVDELLSADGHDFDRAALDGLLADPDVKAWMAAADKLALLPVKRHG